MTRIRKIRTVAVTEYIKWLTNPRIIIFFAMLLFIKTLAIDPLMQRADKMELPINILEPFIAVGNSGMLAMMLPLVFLALMSDFPIISNNTLLFINRIGRINWYLGQMLFSLMSIVTYVLSVFFFSSVFSLNNAYFGTNWSESTCKYIFKFPDDMDSFAAQLLPSNLYNQVSLIDTVIHTIILMTLFLFLLTLIIFLFKILHMRTAGLFSAVVVIACGVVTCSVRMSLQWIFPAANTIIWVHYTEILRKPIMPVWYSYAYFTALIAVFLAVDFIAVKKVNFYGAEDA